MLYRLVFLACALLGAGAVMARGNPHAPALLQMHEEFVEAFVKSQGFGEARITPMMLIMREHQFTHVGETGLCVADVDLIGIARHDPPVAFNAGLVGLMHVERKRPLYREPRALTAMETKAVVELSRGRDLFTEARPGGLHVVAPIRARADCLACHSDKREGEMLGAMSYSMGRLQFPGGDSERRYCR